MGCSSSTSAVVEESDDAEQKFINERPSTFVEEALIDDYPEYDMSLFGEIDEFEEILTAPNTDESVPTERALTPKPTSYQCAVAPNIMNYDPDIAVVILKLQVVTEKRAQFLGVEQPALVAKEALRTELCDLFGISTIPVSVNN